jgi:Protein of unknown function (DUF1579)
MSQTNLGANPHVALFQPMHGTFLAEVAMYMGPGDPFISTGAMVNSWDLLGMFLKQEYTGDQSEGPFPNFQGRGYFGYNHAEECYEGFWIDSASGMMQYEKGTYDPAKRSWEMFSEFTHPETKGRIKKRSVIAIESDQAHTMDTFMTMPDGNTMKVMSIRFTRSGSS